MSSSITIPNPRNPADESKQASSASSSSCDSSPRSPHRAQDPTSPASSSTSSPNSNQKMLHERRPSLLSSAISKEECAFVNIGDPEGPPRLISFLESSQGFAWNPEIFLPSYVECDYTPLENRREPVHEIRVSDEEIENMLPQ